MCRRAPGQCGADVVCPHAGLDVRGEHIHAVARLHPRARVCARGGGAGDLFNRGERTSNTSDAGGEKNVQAMEARLSAMLKDDDDAEVLQVVGKGFSLGASLDDGRPSAAGQPGSASPPPASQPAVPPAAQPVVERPRRVCHRHVHAAP